MRTTAEAQAPWKTRHTTAGPDWAQHYWDSATAPHRALIEPAFQGLDPGSVLELGANAGPNLRLAARRWPAAMLWAVDLNPAALGALAAGAEAEGWASRLVIVRGDCRTLLRALPSRSIDLVFSVYALAYLAPEDLPDALFNAWRVARSRAVFIEPMTHGVARPMIDVDPSGWAHDYPAVIGTFFPGIVAPQFQAITGPDGLNGICTLVKDDDRQEVA